jgi:uncharacterized protein YndB with AHSA1/START domain
VFTVTRTVAATPEQVWEVLSDGWLFPLWVVGATSMRDVDSEWPAPGARLHHSVGAWPMVLSDTTSVVTAEPERFLELEARARPAGSARVMLRLRAVPDGTEITMEEDASHGPGRFLPTPARWLMVVPRNRECLLRLARLVEGRTRHG